MQGGSKGSDAASRHDLRLAEWDSLGLSRLKVWGSGCIDRGVLPAELRQY